MQKQFVMEVRIKTIWTANQDKVGITGTGFAINANHGGIQTLMKDSDTTYSKFGLESLVVCLAGAMCTAINQAEALKMTTREDLLAGFHDTLQDLLERKAGSNTITKMSDGPSDN